MHYYQMTGFMGSTEDTAEPCRHIDLPSLDKAALFLDFDGTLVDIAETPDGITVGDDVTDLLHLADDKLNGRVAIVSGRKLDDLERYLPDFKGNFIGTHGAEFRIDGIRRPGAEYNRATVSRLIRLVEDFAALRPEFLVETKPSGVVLHFRSREAERHSALALNFMDSLASAADGFRLQPALMAYEIKPDNVGKDIALKTLLEDTRLARATPVFAGDDLTDEPALGLVQSRGGIAIKIGEAETVAKHRMADPAALRRCLGKWLG